MREFVYDCPATIEDAIAAMAADGARALAGGTDLIPQVREGRRKVGRIVDLKRIPEMMTISVLHGGGLSIGAAATAAAVARHAGVAGIFPAIAQSARLIGGVQIQNRASLGGNICNAAPSADAVPALICHGASALVASRDGNREVPVADLFAGPGRSALKAGELIVSILVPPPPPRSAAAYLRFTPRREMDIAVAGSGAWVQLGPDGVIGDARIVLASVAPTPIRAPAAEQRLAGERPSRALFEEAGRLAAKRCSAHLGHARVGRLPAHARGRADRAGARRMLPVARGRGRRRMKTLITCTINGEERTTLADTRDTLLELLRDRLGLTGTKEGCSNGNCGTCTVLVDGAPINACLVLALEAPGRTITTIEGLRTGAGLHPIQQALVDHGATQCGFCTPGIVLSAKALLDENPKPTEAEIRHAIAGNLCRCTGYGKIVEAIAAVAASAQEK